MYSIFLFGLYFLAKIDNTFIALQALYSVEIIETQTPACLIRPVLGLNQHPDFTVRWYFLWV